MATTTFYPAAGTNSPVDGGIQGYASSWATTRALAGGNGDLDSGASTNGAVQGEKISSNYYLTRNFFLFDTSAIGTDTVDSATLSLFRSTSGVSNTDTYKAGLSIVSGAPASNSIIGTADYNDVGSTKFANDIDFDTFRNSTTYNDFVLNASGIANINTSGVSKFAQRPSNDFSDSTAPTVRNYTYIAMADTAGTSTDPMLVVVHSASSATSIKSVNGTLQADIKSFAGTAIADIKSINGVSNIA